MEKLIPKLRFPEFREDWKQNQLKSVVSINPKVKPLPEEFIYIDLESVEKGVLLFEKKISKNDAPSRATRTLEKDDILFQTVRPYQRNNYLFIKSESNYVASTGYAQLRTQQIPKFIYQILSTDNFNNDVMNRCTGTSYPAINSTDLGDIKISYPTLQEQTKIADFLGAVDKQLNILNQKKEKLNLYKKGVMQQLFSQQIRFKDDNGNDFPEWEEKTLGEVFKISAGGDVKKENVKPIADEIFKYPIYANSDKNNGLYGYTNDYKIEGETITVTGRGNLGIAVARFEKYYPIVRLLILKPKLNQNILFFKEIINSLNIISESTGVPQLTAPQLSKYKIEFPTLEEQTKIAEFLSAIDKQIETVENQITKTETYKKGLLQQMFV
ncbi:restriction endonuclease subunit S [Empedobacter falsenii]